MSKERLDVVIVNWNSGNTLQNCLESFNDNLSEAIDKIIVFDNDSSDGSEKCVNSQDKAELIRSKCNLGFAKACNKAAEYGNAEWILFLNPDTKLPGGLVSKLLIKLKSLDSIVGALGVQLIDENGSIVRSCTKLPSFSEFVLHSFGIDRIFPQLGFTMQSWNHKDTMHVGHVMGSFYVIRRNLFTKLAGFDERFFLYLEDLDLSMRCAKTGAKILFYADLRVMHIGGGCSRQIKARRLFYDLQSRVIFARIHFTKCWMIYLLATVGVEPFARLLTAIFFRSYAVIKETCEAYRLFFKWLSKRKM